MQGRPGVSRKADVNVTVRCFGEGEGDRPTAVKKTSTGCECSFQAVPKKKCKLALARKLIDIFGMFAGNNI